MISIKQRLKLRKLNKALLDSGVRTLVVELNADTLPRVPYLTIADRIYTICYILIAVALACAVLEAYSPRTLRIAQLVTGVATVIAYAAYYWMLQHAPPALTSTYAYATPVIAVLLGVLLLDEPITPMQLLGSALVLVSVLIVGRATRGRAMQGAD